MFFGRRLKMNANADRRNDDCYRDEELHRQRSDSTKRNEGTVCDAYNGHGGRGVVAKAMCQKIDITCSTPVGNMPSIRCPSGYLLTGCTMHSSIRHNLWYDYPPRHPTSEIGENDMDVVFVVDVSSGGSMDMYWSKWPEYDVESDIRVSISLAKEYLSTIVIPENLHFGYVVYSRGIDYVRNMSQPGLHHQPRFPYTPYTGSDKALHEALDEARYMLKFYGRPATDKTVIIITDGQCSDEKAVEASIAALHSEGVVSVVFEFTLEFPTHPTWEYYNSALLSKLSGNLSRVHIHGFHWFEEAYWENGRTESMRQYELGTISPAFPGNHDHKDFCFTTEGCSSCSVQARCVALYE